MSMKQIPYWEKFREYQGLRKKIREFARENPKWKELRESFWDEGIDLTDVITEFDIHFLAWILAKKKEDSSE